MGLRISRDVADRLLGDEDRVDTTRPLAVDDAREARGLAARLSGEGIEPGISAGRLSGAVQLAWVLRRRLEDYFDASPELLDRLLAGLVERSSAEEVHEALATFGRDVLGQTGVEPRPAVEGDRQADGDAASVLDLRTLLLEAILTWALESNPSAAPIARGLQGPKIWSSPAWRRLIGELSAVLGTAPPLDDGAESLGDSLLAPARFAPDSLTAQLRYLLDRWRSLGVEERRALVSSLDLIAEEEAPRFVGGGPGPVELPDYDDFEDESPNYTPDLHWMEPLVLIAKNCVVWLDQLSREYGHEITRIDQIPDQELDRLAGRGIRGLWLIGIWQRSSASAEIKRRLGNAEAVASAYSLRDYEIAAELGGPDAADNLAARAGERGIRLAADMVPNHMGIDSRWLIEHPERFLSVPDCPFPAYTFEGPDLSPDSRVGIFLEDHYWDRSDAAVVFKRVDRETGDVRYVYHGNDGTHTPWNDTAQLDYLNPETRRAVIGAILGVAARFPIIRFDAAMTLARRHVQRLWFPEPGHGGAIPSRADHALTRAEFKRAMPAEFWREVVDLVTEERPDTLLLAEAFWLMEGYFVRSLGMHRVYNSAFMNLLGGGETAKLRRMIQETVDFDPQILKRYVNFLSNPDEEPAIEQFGWDDRYFGACVVMATLPGLPMVAHGQFEGYYEKYGMEYQRPRMYEEPNEGLLARHRREIFPLLRRRERFVGVDRFRLLDLIDERREVNGNVLAYANGDEIDRSIVLFNNSPDRVRGRLASVGELFEAEPGSVYRFRDQTTRLHFLARVDDLRTDGLQVDLAPFESRVLVDFRPVSNAVKHPYLALAERLGGCGVGNLDLEVAVEEYRPLIEALQRFLASTQPEASSTEETAAARRQVEERAAALRPGLDVAGLREGLRRAEALVSFGRSIEELPWPSSRRMRDARRRLVDLAAPEGRSIEALRVLQALSAVRVGLEGDLAGDLGVRLLEELTSGSDEVPALGLALEEEWLTPCDAPGRGDLARMIEGWATRPDARDLLGLNRHDGEDWVRKEDLKRLLRWCELAALAAQLTTGQEDENAAVVGLGWVESVDLLARLFTRDGYAFERVRERLRGRQVDPRPAAATRPGAGAEDEAATRGKKAVRRRRKRRSNRPS